MSQWHKPDPPDGLWSQESRHWQTQSGILAWRGYVALQKWRHGQPLSPQDVEGLELSPDSLLLQPRQPLKVKEKVGIVTRCLRFFSCTHRINE
jgi:hypothetical protein